MTGTDGHVHLPPGSGLAVATGLASLNGQPETAFVPVPGATIVLPSAGTYDVWADVHGGMVANEPPTDETIFARLFNVTAGAGVPNSETAVVALTNWADDPPDPDTPNAIAHHAESTASLRMPITVTGPTTIRVEAYHEVGGNFGASGSLAHGATLSAVGTYPGEPEKGVTRVGFIKLN